MAANDEVVIISGCRTPVGKFQGSLSDLSATQLGAIVVREAVKRANLDPKQVDECIMGNVVSAGLGQNPARQAAIFGGLRSGSGCHDHQQGLRFRTQSGRTRGASHPDGEQFHRRRRRHGIDDQRSLSAAASAQRISSGQRTDRRLHGERRPLGHLQQLPHGHHRRERSGKIRHHPRGAGPVRGQLSPQSAGSNQGMPLQVADRPSRTCPQRKKAGSP